MAIQFNGSAYLQAPAGWQAEDYSDFTCVFIFQFNGQTRPAGWMTAVYNNAYRIQQGNFSDHATTEITAYQTDLGVARPWVAATVGGFPMGVPVMVALSYSVSDPSRRFVEINGRRASATWASVFENNLRLDADWFVGSEPDGRENDLTIQSLLFINEALTDEQLDAFREASTADTVATFDATMKRFYSCNGTVGQDVETGDPGISIPGDPDHSWVAVPAEGSILRYVEPIAAQRAKVDQVYVTTSGKALILSLTKPGIEDGLVKVSDAAIAAMTYPTIRVNGGAPITLDDVDSHRGYFYGPNGAFFWLLPEGVGPLTNSDLVTISAPRDWIDSDVGGTDGMTDRVVDMRVGMPCSKPSDGLIKVGGQTTTLGAAVWSSQHVVANATKFIMNGGPVWPDGTMKSPFTQDAYWFDGRDYYTSYGYSNEALLGDWLLQWKDGDDSPAPFTSMNVKSNSVPVVTEVVPGWSSDVDGKHCRVVNVKKNVWNLTLDGPIDADDDVIPVTSGPTAPFFGTPNPPVFLIIQIGDEKIKATGWTTGAFTGCTRGWNGTTAASHADGASLTSWQTDTAFILQVWSDHDDTYRYKDLQLYAPGDWDKPAGAAAPLTYVEEDPYKISSYFWEHYLSNGMGPHRLMECAGAMADDRSEVVDFTSAAEPMWSWKTPEKIVFSHVEPFTPLVGPTRYYYFNYQADYLETYSATLVDAINASQTTIRLTRTTTEPDARIPKGQAVFIDGERMQVIGIPAIGDDHYEVLRGRINTAAASHSAGATATVGWRKAITTTNQYLPQPEVATTPGEYYKSSEIFVDEALSLSPMRTGLIMEMGGANANRDDMILEARRNFTLTQVLAPGDLTVHIEPEDEGDWDWIAESGWVYIAGERMLITAVDSGAGTITIRQRDNDGYYSAWPRVEGVTVAPTDRAIGTAGTQTAQGPMWTNADGSIRYYQPLFNYGPPLLPTGAASAAYFISGDTHEGSTVPMTVVPGQHFNTTLAFKHNSDFSVQQKLPWYTIPYDFHAHMCKRTREASVAGSGDAWVCLSYGLSDDAIYEIVKIYRDILPAGCKLYVEYGNEVWNYLINKLRNYANSHAWSVGIADNMLKPYYHFLRSCRIFEIGRACYAEVGREDDFVSTLAWQIGGSNYISEALTHIDGLGYTVPRIDAIADAPYTILSPEDQIEHYKPVFDACDNPQAVDLLLFQFEFGKMFTSMAGTIKPCRDAIEALTGHRPAYVCYEGGPGDMGPVVPGSWPDYYNVRVKDFLRTMDLISHPNFRHWMRSFFDVLRRRLECEAISIFCFGRTPGQSGGYAMQLFWGMAWFERHRVGLCDGTDGGPDNTQFCWNPDDPNWVNPEYGSPGLTNANPNVMAFKQHNTAMFGAAGPEEPEFVLEADGVTITWGPFPEPYEWQGGVVVVSVDENAVGCTQPTEGTTGTEFELILTDPVTSAAVVTVDADAGVAMAVSDGTFSLGTGAAGSLPGTVVNNSAYTPGGGSGFVAHGYFSVGYHRYSVQGGDSLHGISPTTP